MRGPTQKERLKQLFMSRPNINIPLHEILTMGIAQYGARILELRREGMNIQNITQFIAGVQHSWFRWIPGARDYKKQEEFIYEEK